MIGIEIEMEVRPRKRSEFLQALESLVPSGEGAGACVSCAVYENVDHHNRFLWVERWPDREQLQQRLSSDPFRALMGAVRVLADDSRMEVVLASDPQEEP